MRSQCLAQRDVVKYAKPRPRLALSNQSSPNGARLRTAAIHVPRGHSKVDDAHVFLRSLTLFLLSQVRRLLGRFRWRSLRPTPVLSEHFVILVIEKALYGHRLPVRRAGGEQVVEIVNPYRVLMEFVWGVSDQ